MFDVCSLPATKNDMNDDDVDSDTMQTDGANDANDGNSAKWFSFILRLHRVRMVF